MQRYIAGVLVFLMLGQTSGVAIAGPSSDKRSFDFAGFFSAASHFVAGDRTATAAVRPRLPQGL